MNQVLDCPKCGAPLKFEPRPGMETIECSYCHETVIIPESMRIPLPRPVSKPLLNQSSPKQINPMTRLLVISGSVVVVAGFIIFTLFINASNDNSNSLSADTNNDITLSQPVINDGTATIEAQSTDIALQPLLTQARSWPTSFSENFMDNNNNWDTGDVRDGYITGNRTIRDGTYTWNVTTLQSSIDFSYPDMPDQQDFYANVTVNLLKMPEDHDADAGLLLRYDDTGQTWYYFSVNNYGEYYFGWYDGDNWHSLIPETSSPVIKTGQTNRIGVVVQGSQFNFLINDEVVDHFVDESLQKGIIGLAINLPQEGQKATVVFSNLSVQSSP